MDEYQDTEGQSKTDLQFLRECQELLYRRDPSPGAVLVLVEVLLSRDLPYSTVVGRSLLGKWLINLIYGKHVRTPAAGPE